MESIISGCGKFNRNKDKDLIEARSALVQAWIDDVERVVEKVDKNLPDMMARHIADICYRESEQLKKQITMGRKIGEIFEYKGEWYQCVEGTGCYQCAFNRDGNTCTADDPHCVCRSDKKDVVFKKLEKVGEPYMSDGHLMQTLSGYTQPIYFQTKGRELYFSGCYLRVEIKQNQEDMEEKKQKLDKLVDDYMACRIQYTEFDKEIKALYDKEDSKPTLKEFDLEAAKAGKPVCTRDGRKARIICFDSNGGRPIVALVTECDDEEEIPYKYHCDGSYNCQSIPSDNDLMMLPEKKEMWINIYKSTTNYISGGGLYDTEEEAKAGADMADDDYFTTAKVSWEV